ncbi:MAG TPA: sugar ABC transporter permease [Solirubrobacterales bacterium]|nr:sugar ABC transporter permease [Solirubrobacterales bacterium]
MSTAVAAGALEALAAPSPERQRAKKKAAWRRRRFILLCMSPWIVGFTIFFGYPLVTTVLLSFTHYDLLSDPRWIGTANYSYLFGADQQIWPSVYNTLWMICIAVPIEVLFAFSIAVMITRARMGVGLFRTIFYLPTMAPAVAATLGFVFLFNPATGPVNTILGHLGITGPLWFQSPSLAKPSLTLLGIWGIGNTMIIFLAALLDVPKHLYESSELDGAGAWQRLRYITLPTISPVILFAVVIGVIEGLQYFTEGYVASTVAAGGSGGGAGDAINNLGYPQDSTLFYPLLLYQQGFRYFNMGYASAMAVLLLIVSLAVTVVILRRSDRFVHYAGAPR